MTKRMLPGLCVALLCLGGCGGDDGSNPFESDTGTATSPTSVTATATTTQGTDGTATSTSDSGSASATDSGGSTAGGTGVKFDTPDGMTAGTAETGTGDGCKKIDFLFVVDNSGSMAAHQQNLINNFGPFMDTIAATVDAQDYNVMLLDSDACYVNMSECQPPPTDCEQLLGSGQVRDCGVPGGLRYLSSSISTFDEMKTIFQCLGDVGVEGSANELPMSAMKEAITTHDGAGQCNEGFLRDDAVLVITIITDDHPGWLGTDDSNSVGSPQEWYDAVIQAKQIPENVVVLGLFALPAPAPQDCVGFGPPDVSRFTSFVDMFGMKGVLGSVCQPDYNAFFQDAVSLIDSTCDDFVPPG